MPLERGSALRLLQDHLRQLEDGELVGVADVHGVVLLRLEQAEDPVGFVFDIAKRPSLRAVAIYGDRVPADRLHNEIRDHPGRPQASFGARRC